MNTKNAVRLLFVSLIAVLIILNCSAVNKVINSIQRPNVTVDKVRVSGLSLDDIDLMFDLKVNNPNGIGINLAGFDYDFLLSGNSFVKGNQNKGLEIAANGESTVQLPITLAFANIYRAYSNLKDHDSADYEIRMGFAFNLPVVGDVRVPVSHKGMLPMVKIPTFKVHSLRMEHLSLSGADLKLQIAVDNPNAFSLKLDEMDYQFAVNGKSWISGQSQNVVQLNQKSLGIIDIPISLNFLEVGQSVYQLLNGGNQLNYDFMGYFGVGSSIPVFESVRLPVEKEGMISLSQ